MAGSVSGIDKGTKAPRILSDAWENGCQRGRMDMSKYSREDIIRMVEDEDVEFIRLQFTDIFGILKNVAITASQLNKALNNDCMFDGSAIEGFVRIDESDMYLHPDLDTFEIFPWRPQQGKVARLICDVYNPDGTPFIGDPRYVLKRAVKRAADMGYTFQVGPECEFSCSTRTKREGLLPSLMREPAILTFPLLILGKMCAEILCSIWKIWALRWKQATMRLLRPSMRSICSIQKVLRQQITL